MSGWVTIGSSCSLATKAVGLSMPSTASIAESGAAPASPLTTLGGGSRDPAYVALVADALGIALRPASVADAAVVGAARLGASATGESIPPVAIDSRGIVEPAGDPVIASRQERWRAAVRRELRGGDA